MQVTQLRTNSRKDFDKKSIKEFISIFAVNQNAQKTTLKVIRYITIAKEYCKQLLHLQTFGLGHSFQL